MTAATSPLLPRPARIRRVVRETRDTFTLDLDAPAGAESFRPGQFNMLYAFGVGDVPISISGDAARRDVLVHTTRMVGTVTAALGRLRRGAAVGVRGPFGRPWPLEACEGRDVVIVAGGIGLAPLRAVLYELVRRRAEFGRIVLLYGTRGPDDVLFLRELERWRRAKVMEVAITVDRGVGRWHGHVGVVTTLVPRAPFDSTTAVALVCGPEIMMRFAADALRRRGLPPERIFVSLERNMKCAVGLCGRCQLGPAFVCKDGPVFSYATARPLLEGREL
jgi:NAD(P)H-flavin reductase